MEIQVADGDLQLLKANGYSLCFATTIEGREYDVIMRAYDEFLSSNVFVLEPGLTVFGSVSFNVGAEVSISTNQASISVGQRSTLSGSGIMEPPVTGTSPLAVQVINDFGSIHIGLSQAYEGIDQRSGIAPAYLSETTSVKGRVELVRKASMLVWFEQGARSGMIFDPELRTTSTAVSRAVEIDLSVSTSQVRRYEDQTWVIPPTPMPMVR